MLYLLYGTNYTERHARVQALLSEIEKENPLLLFRIAGDEFSETSFRSYLGRTSLFAEVPVVLISGALDDTAAQETVTTYAQDLQQADQVFIFTDEVVPKKVITAIEKVAGKVESFTGTVASNETFNIFGITDAFGRRDRKQVWMLYQRALKEGVDPQEVLNILLWQVKTVLIVAENSRPSSLKPFVIQKAMQTLKKYSTQELLNVLERLTTLHHTARRGADLEVTLERELLLI